MWAGIKNIMKYKRKNTMNTKIKLKDLKIANRIELNF